MTTEVVSRYISIQKRELHIDSGIFQNLSLRLSELTKSENFNEAYDKVRKESKVKLRTKNTFYEEVFSVSKRVVKLWARSLNLVSVPGLYSDIDIQKGKYEGGFKVWECAIDLVKYISENHLIAQLLHRKDLHKFNALELGAGASLPSLTLLSRIIADEQFTQPFRIHIQDYNWQVLCSLTLMNFAFNLPLDYLEALINTNSLKFFHGDWKEWECRYKYDLIMMSEVMYNADNFESLYLLLVGTLKRNGYAVIATKNTYFGLTGGLDPWLDFLKTRPINDLNVVDLFEVTTMNVPRSILVLCLI